LKGLLQERIKKPKTANFKFDYAIKNYFAKTFYNRHVEREDLKNNVSLFKRIEKSQ